MSEPMSCPNCGCRLIGSIETVWVDRGKFTCLVTRASPDCNWQRCWGCKDVICRTCYADRQTFCCDEDRIVWRERAQAIADLDHRSQNTNRSPDP